MMESPSKRVLPELASLRPNGSRTVQSVFEFTRIRNNTPTESKNGSTPCRESGHVRFPGRRAKHVAHFQRRGLAPRLNHHRQAR